MYLGYSEGICILGPTIKGIHLIDDINSKLHGDYQINWNGLNIIDYFIVPHYKSDHPETKLADKAVNYLKREKIKFKTLRYGDVIIIN